MKNVFFVFLLLFGIFQAFSQQQQLKIADKKYNDLAYVDAINDYLKIVNTYGENLHIQTNLANAYYNIFNSVESEKWFSNVVLNSTNKEYFFRYAQMLKANGKYKKAKFWMNKFSEIAPNDIRGLEFKENIDIVGQILEGKPKFEIFTIKDFNTKYADFGPILHNNQLYYVSARSGKSKKYGWNKEPFLDIYRSDFDTLNTTFSNQFRLGNQVNTNKNEGTVSFSPDGKTMYFSGESINRYAGLFKKKFKKDITGKSTINIYAATINNGVYTNIVSLPFNKPNYNFSGPAISPDGKRLYFCSDMKGTFGGSDLWYVDINFDGSFGKPVNLGNTINTEGSEMFPYVSSKNILYFSSNGHQGLGMLDVFATQIKDEQYGPVRNLGKSLNSSKDDFSFTINEKNNTGFFASNRSGGQGSDDIYRFKKISSICDVRLSIKVLDENNSNILPNTLVTIYDKNNNKLSSKSTDVNGFVDFIIECNKQFRLEFDKKLYTIGNLDIEGTNKKSISKKITLSSLIKENKVLLNPIYFDLDKHNIKAKAATELNKLVSLMNTYPKMIIKVYSHTDSRADDNYNISLSNKRANSTVQYVISKGIEEYRISGVGKGETELTNNCSNGIKCTKEAHQANRRSEFIIVNDGAYR